MRYTQVKRCRICGGRDLVPVLDLGSQALTGVFPKCRSSEITVGPLQLLKCIGGEQSCGLVQLGHSFSLDEMYGENYGYRSGLNQSMVSHLQDKVSRIRGMIDLADGDLVVDIGSNDGTTLAAYPSTLERVGIDPTAAKFARFYPTGSRLIDDFFSADVADAHGLTGRAKVVTSISMFYDLESPLQFMSDVQRLLAGDGIWILEQSYLPAMLQANAFDTVCHEHLEYYALRQIKWMADRVGLTLIDIEFNDVNGGSFSVAVTKSPTARESPLVQEVLARERGLGLDGLGPWKEFAGRVSHSRDVLRDFVKQAREGGSIVAALGASTKGNVLLQYCRLGPADIECVGEVNSDKFGAYTPGTWIPILPESELLARKPDYLIVLPWHFKQHFVASPAFAGSVLVFPLPFLEIVDRRCV